MNYDKIKPEVIQSIKRYVEHHCPVGDFLMAVLCNDLTEACGRADDENRQVIPEIVCYCYNEIPYQCWGSPARVEKWLSERKAVA